MGLEHEPASVTTTPRFSAFITSTSFSSWSTSGAASVGLNDVFNPVKLLQSCQSCTKFYGFANKNGKSNSSLLILKGPDRIRQSPTLRTIQKPVCSLLLRQLHLDCSHTESGRICTTHPEAFFQLWLGRFCRLCSHRKLTDVSSPLELGDLVLIRENMFFFLFLATKNTTQMH